jgi:hypothetical protein
LAETLPETCRFIITNKKLELSASVGFSHKEFHGTSVFLYECTATKSPPQIIDEIPQEKSGVTDKNFFS